MKRVYDLEVDVAEYLAEAQRELPFDKYRLDEEFERQPQTYLNWASLYARALTERKRLEAELDKVKGAVDLEVRRDPVVYGLELGPKGEAPKEAAIRAVVNTHKSLKEAEAQFYKAHQLQYLLEHIVKSFEQRKELLRAEGELWREGYYSSPSVGSAVQREGRRAGNSEEKERETGGRVPRRRIG